MTTSHPEIPQRGVRKQVILPTSIAFGICMRGIKTRLGRSLVTLFGVSLGIAFLMSVVTGFHINQRMRKEAASARDVDQRVNVLRNEIGRLQDKELAVVMGGRAPIDAAFLEALKSLKVKTGALKGGTAGAVLLLGDYGPALTPEVVREISGRPVFDFRPSHAAASPTSVSIKHLGISLRPGELARAKHLETQERYRTWWIVGVSLLITVIGIANAMLMSVTERIREIGTMKCLGALSGFVVKLFLIESSLMGLAGAVLGGLAGMGFSLLAYSLSFGFVKVWTSVSYGTLSLYGIVCIVVGVVLAVVAGIYPARVASKMIPASALSSNV